MFIYIHIYFNVRVEEITLFTTMQQIRGVKLVIFKYMSTISAVERVYIEKFKRSLKCLTDARTSSDLVSGKHFTDFSRRTEVSGFNC